MIINDLDGYYIVFDTKNWNTELDTLLDNQNSLLTRDFYSTFATEIGSFFRKNDKKIRRI